MGDKAILTNVLEASNLTEAYVDLTAKQLIKEIRHVGDDLAVQYSNLDDRMELGEPSDQRSPTDGEKTFTVDDAVEALGFGRFQLKLSILTGMAWMADAMEMMLLSLISPALACEWGISSVQQALVTTCVFSGMMLSSTFWGKICDRFGRRKGLTFSTLVACIMGVFSAFSPHFYVLLLFRGLTGFGIGGVPQSVTLYAEFLPTAQRAKCVVLIESFWAIGAVFEALLAYFVMNAWGWRALMLFSSLPLGIFSVASFWLPESARFDMASGHPERALETLQMAARMNRVMLPTGRLVSHTKPGSGSESRGDIVNLLSPELRKTTLLLWCIWAITAFSYYGTVLFTTVLFQSHDECHGGLFSNGTQLEVCQPLTRSDYFDLLSTTLAEFPGLIITVLIIEWFGRKKTMAVEYAIFAIFTFLLYFCLDRFTVTVLIFVARAFISGAFQCAYVYTPEVYPTTLRAVGLGTCSAMARIGAIVTPFIAQVSRKKRRLGANYTLVMARQWFINAHLTVQDRGPVASEQSLSLPIGIYGTAAILGLIASLSLPIETKDRRMTDSH
uniref:MFS domain-containing protein n=1 Tax=Caenorhabditis japonica TaxID=281687 RepID=A0A8R1HUC3_CAEJA